MSVTLSQNVVAKTSGRSFVDGVVPISFVDLSVKFTVEV